MELGNLVKQLTDIAADECGVDFKNRNLNWKTADDVKDVVAAMEKVNSVHFLQLSGNVLSVEAAAAIGRALQRHPECRKVLLKSLFGMRSNETELPEALSYLSHGLMTAQAHLAVLDVSNTAMGAIGLMGLERLLRSPVCYSLIELRLNNCGLRAPGGKLLAMSLIECHAASTAAGTPLKLKIFVAGRNYLQNGGASEIANLLATIKTLEEVSMAANAIKPPGMVALANALERNPKLRSINVNDNFLNTRGAVAFAEAFAHTPYLQHVDFGDCLMKTDGACFLAGSLERGYLELETLDVSGNEIFLKGGLAMVKAVLNKPKLSRLNLDGNQFEFEGRAALREAMEVAINPQALSEMADQSESEDEGGEFEYNCRARRHES